MEIVMLLCISTAKSDRTGYLGLIMVEIVLYVIKPGRVVAPEQ